MAATAAIPRTQGWKLHVAGDRIQAPGYLQLSDCQTEEAELPGIGKPVSGIWVLLEQLGLGFLYSLPFHQVSECCSSGGVTGQQQKGDDGCPTPQLPTQTHKHTHSISGNNISLPSLFSECFRGRRAEKKGDKEHVIREKPQGGRQRKK